MAEENILIVEDEFIIAMDIQNSLERNRFQIAGHTDRGEVAVKMSGELHPDLILMDINLKGEMDGIDAAIQIRRLYDIPVIFLTAFGNDSTLERARVAEPFGYVLKPYEERDLVISIEMALYKHSMERKLRESENKFHSVVENASDGIVIIDGQGSVIEWNRTMEQVTGLEKSTVIGQPVWETIFQILPQERRTADVKEANMAQWKAAIENRYENNDYIMEYEIESMNGAQRFVQSHGFNFKTTQGTMGGVIIRDITEQRQVETQLRKLSQAVEQSANTIVLTDVEGNIEYANPKFTEFSGYSIQEVIGGTPRILRSGEHSLEFYQNLWQTIKAGDTWRGEFHNKRKDGSLYWEEATIAPVFDANNKIINFIAVKEDITSRKMLEEAERDQRRLAEALLDSAMTLNGSLQLDEVLDRILANIGKLVPYDAAMVSLIEGESVRKIRYHNNPQNSMSQLPVGNIQANLLNIPILKTILKTKQAYSLPDIQNDPRWQTISVPGMQRVRSLICVPVEIHGEVIGIINIIGSTPNLFNQLHINRIKAFASQAAVAIDNAQLYEQAKRLSTIDPLTEIFNMRYFLDFSSLEFERSQRYSRTISIAMIDIDHFKKINDTYGHSMGDIVLRETAQCIKRSIRSVDVIARYGGEEFVILMPETGLSEALDVAERIRSTVNSNQVITKDAQVSVTLSVGVAEKNSTTAQLEDVIKLADKALYEAKNTGRNRVEAFAKEHQIGRQL